MGQPPPWRNAILVSRHHQRQGFITQARPSVTLLAASSSTKPTTPSIEFLTPTEPCALFLCHFLHVLPRHFLFVLLFLLFSTVQHLEPPPVASRHWCPIANCLTRRRTHPPDRRQSAFHDGGPLRAGMPSSIWRPTRKSILTHHRSTPTTTTIPKLPPTPCQGRRTRFPTRHLHHSAPGLRRENEQMQSTPIWPTPSMAMATIATMKRMTGND